MKQRLINYLLKHLLCTITPEDIISHEKGILRISGKELNNTELQSLINEAKVLEQLRIWHIFNQTIRAEAMDRGFNKSVTFDDLKTCKLMLYNLDVLNSIIKIIRSKEKVVI